MINYDICGVKNICYYLYNEHFLEYLKYNIFLTITYNRLTYPQ